MKPLPERERGVIRFLNEQTGRGEIQLRDRAKPQRAELPFDYSAIQYDDPVVGDQVSFIREGYCNPSAINILLMERVPRAPEG